MRASVWGSRVYSLLSFYLCREDYGIVRRLEGGPVWIQDQPQFAGEKAMLSTILSNVDHTRGRVLGQQCLYPLACERFELIERAIDHQPLRALQQYACEGEILFLAFAQSPVPPLGGIEMRQQMFQSHGRERAVEGCRLILIGPMRVRERVTQCSWRQVRSPRQEHHRLPRRPRDPPMSPGPDPYECLQQQRAARSVLGHDECALRRFELHVRLTQADAAFGGCNAQIFDAQAAVVRLLQLDAIDRLTEDFHGGRRTVEACNTPARGTPVRQAGEVIHEPSQRALHLIECADYHHQLTEAHVPRQIARRRHQDGGDDREPAVAGGDPGQPGESTYDAPGDFE